MERHVVSRQSHFTRRRLHACESLRSFTHLDLCHEHSQQKTYVCTSDAVRGGFCDNSQLGRFIIDLPEGKSLNETSFWSARVTFSSVNREDVSDSTEIASNGFWDNPEGNPTPPDANSDYTTPWRRGGRFARSLPQQFVKRQDSQPSPPGILYYHEPIQYFVRKTGYFCVGKTFFAIYNWPLTLLFLQQSFQSLYCHPAITVTHQGRLRQTSPSIPNTKALFYSKISSTASFPLLSTRKWMYAHSEGKISLYIN